MIIHALQTATPFVFEIFRKGYCIHGNCTSDKYFLFKWSTRLQSMYNRMVGRTASVISPFYSFTKIADIFLEIQTLFLNAEKDVLIF